MPRYVAFLRGVTPKNLKMPDLKHAFEVAGFTNVRTLLSSGNVAFDARSATDAALERKAEEAMQRTLGRSFHTIVRPVAALERLLDTDPYARFNVPPHAKRVVSFLRVAPTPKQPLPLARDGAQVLTVIEREAFTCYVTGDKGPVFMVLIERVFGTDVTTRTWDTVRRCAKA